MRGPARVASNEQSYFADKGRAANEIQAVVRASRSRAGGADGAIVRTRFVEAFRIFLNYLDSSSRPKGKAAVATYRAATR